MNLKKIIVPFTALFLTAALLFGVSTGLKPLVARKREKDKIQTMALLLPGSKTFTPKVYEGEDTNITAVFKAETGYVIETTVAGYVDNIKMLVGVNTEGSVTGAVVCDMAETYGLGRRAMSDMTFLAQFLGTKADAQVGNNIDAISGATVTSKAVAKAVNSAAAFVTGADVSSGATGWGG